ncbi:MAG: o-succinylbenzoate synthase [Synechocystis sp.]|nr:o-succinylbenzoate synthase [Synechocystis sp.]
MSNVYLVDYQPYQFPLAFPLTTAHGHWTHREGITINLTDENGNTSQGEIAPLPWFGTENLDQATEFCQQLNGFITPDQIDNIPDRLPCCQFAFGSAAWGFSSPNNSPLDLNYCQLLPTGEAVFDYLDCVPSLPCQTLKWKIGVQNFDIEQQLLLNLWEKLPPQTRLRLDANGGLTEIEAQQWLTLLDRQQENASKLIQIEYLEQPLTPHHLNTLFTLAQTYQTAIALDESVASFKQLQHLYDQQWPGIYVLKAAIMGDPRQLSHWLSTHPIKAIFSSVFETAIGRQQVLQLAQQWNLKHYAVGFSPISPQGLLTKGRQQG